MKNGAFAIQENSTTGRIVLRSPAQRAARLFAIPSRSPAAAPAPVEGAILRARAKEVRGVELATWEWTPLHADRPREGLPAVLLVHGWSGHASQLDGFVAPLVARGLRVVAFDQPAHGVSGGRRATIDDMADAVAGIAATSGSIQGVIGHSLGATATALALARGLRAERVALFAPAAEVQYFAVRFATAIGLPVEAATEMLAVLREELGGDLDAFDVRLLARRFGTAALVLHDFNDTEVPFEHGRAIAEAWPGAALRTLRGLGHNRPIRDRETIEAAVRFVAGEEVAS